MEDVKEEPTLEERLEAAAAESSIVAEVEDMTDEEVAAELERIEADQPENRVPQSRFNEVNSALRELRETEAEMREQLIESQDKLIRMQELLEARSADVATLNEIKSFINDPDMKDHVLAIDAKLRGVELELEHGTIEPEDAVLRTQAMLEEARMELRDTQADIQADQLISKADSIAERLLSALPEEYNYDDRNIINELFTDRVDWDAAVAYPDHLAEILTQGFQDAIDRYGTPRGALFDTEEVDLLTEDVATGPTPEEELEALMDLPWGDIRETDLGDGNVLLEPEMSDDDFNAVLAKAIRVSHGRDR